MKFSSEPPTAALFLVGKPRHRDWNFRATLKISIEIEIFERDRIFSIVGPSGVASSYIHCVLVLRLALCIHAIALMAARIVW